MSVQCLLSRSGIVPHKRSVIKATKILSPVYPSRAASICQPTFHSVRSRLLPPCRSNAYPQCRNLVSSSILQKSKSKEKQRDSPQKSGLNSNNQDPYDLEQLQQDLAKASERLKHDLTVINRNGRVGPEIIENLRVALPAHKGTPDRTAKIDQIAQVMRRGRTIEVLAEEQRYVKQINSAIMSSPHSLNARPDPTGSNPLLLIVEIPPPTAESRAVTFEKVHQLGNTANREVTAARASQQKKFRAMRMGRLAPADDIEKAHKRMNELCDAKNKECKEMTEVAKKGLDMGSSPSRR